MKLKENNFGFESHLPEERISFKIKSSAKIFNILSSGIYEDKILAVIRELSCNAFDAHIAAGKRETPFCISLPNYLEPTFSITDEGTGINPLKIGDVFWTYGESTKADSNEFIGALGLGSKSPFAYTKSSFTVRNRYKGKEYMYMCFINEHGTPDGSHLATIDSTQTDGITIEFAVRQEDIEEFYKSTASFFKTWDGVLPVFTGHKITIPVPNKIKEGRTWYLESARYESRNSVALMGNVPYKINPDLIKNLPNNLKIICVNKFVLKFPMGAISFAPSREGLEYDEETCKALIDALEVVRVDIVESFHKNIFASKTHVEFINTFKKELQAFKNAFNFISDRDDTSTTELIFGKSLLESIQFLGENYVLENLTKGRFTKITPGIAPFGLYSSSGINSYLKMTCLSTVQTEDLINYDLMVPYEKYSSITKTKSVDQFSYSGFAGNEEHYNWSPAKTKLVRNHPQSLLKAKFLYWKQNPQALNVITKTQFNIYSNSVLIIVNNLGRVGVERAIAYLSKNRSLDIQILFANNPDLKVDFASIVKDVTAWIGDPKFGITVKLISDIEDCRTKVEVENIPKDLIKVPVARYGMQSSISTRPLTKDKFVRIDGYSTKVNASHKKTFKILDLKNMDRVFYTTRDKSGDVYEPGPVEKVFKLDSTKVLDVINNEGFHKDLLGANSIIPVINLTETQVNSLKKKGVNLVTISSVLSTSVQKIVDSEQLVEKISSFKSKFTTSKFSDYAGTITALYNYSKRINQHSVLHKLFEMYVEFANSKVEYERNVSRYNSFSDFVDISNTKAVIHKPKNVPDIFKKYPLLKMLLSAANSTMSHNMSMIINYINDCDKVDPPHTGDEICNIFDSNIFNNESVI